MSKELNIGIIGAGRISKVHTPLLAQRIPHVNVLWLCDLNASLAQELAGPLGLHVTTDYHKILADKKIDAVFVLSSTDSHVPIILDAVKAGKHIFCEKPINNKADEIRKVIKAVESAGIKFQVGFNRRFDRNFSHIKKTVDMGKIGQVQIIKITSRDPKVPPLSFIETSGGMFADMSIHDFDMVQFISGALVTEVSVMGTNLINPDFSNFGDVDTCIIMLKLDNGALAVIDNSRQAVYGYDQRLEVFGSKGMLLAKNEKPNNTTLLTADAVCQEKPLWFFLERYADAFLYEDMSFVESCLKDRPTLIGVRGGLSPVLIADAAMTSHKMGGMPVRVEY